MSFPDSSSAAECYLQFIKSCSQGAATFGLTPRSDSSSYSLCFALMGISLLKRYDFVTGSEIPWAQIVRNNVRALREHSDTSLEGKPYRQLLAFSLSTLAALGALKEDPLEDLVSEQIPGNIRASLDRHGVFQGRPQSGNQAMFHAIFLLHARDVLGLPVQQQIEDWVQLHLESMNRYGFWGRGGMTHLQFQNGYHQYEILEYLAVENPCRDEAIVAVHELADSKGHFAPYPGGGGCYDYDAVFILTPEGKLSDSATAPLVRRTVTSILAEQSSEGGWAETTGVRPRSLSNLYRSVQRIKTARNPTLFKERLRYGITLQRPKHDRIHTHWSRYSRAWNEADLWDSYFRMLTVARVEVALTPEVASRWGFLPYPGIGYHPTVPRMVAT